MSDRFFLDTNVFAYTFDETAPAKRGRARELIRHALETRSGFISTQVLQEFLNLALRKLEPPLETQDAEDYLDRVLEPLCEVFPSVRLYRSALHVVERWQYSFYDSLILAAALEGKAQVLYTEDLQYGHKVEDLRIENPFR